MLFTGQDSTREVSDGGVRIALLLPLSGVHAEIGQAFLNAAQMALFDMGGPGLVLMPIDTAGTPDRAAEATAVAVRRGAALILGPLFSASVAAAAPVGRAAGIGKNAFTVISPVPTTFEKFDRTH